MPLDVTPTVVCARARPPGTAREARALVNPLTPPGSRIPALSPWREGAGLLPLTALALLCCATPQRAVAPPLQTSAKPPLGAAAQAQTKSAPPPTDPAEKPCDRLASSVPLVPGGELRCHGYPFVVRFPDAKIVTSASSSLEQTFIRLADDGALAITVGVNLRGLSGLPVDAATADKQARVLLGALGMAEQGVVPVPGFSLPGAEAAFAIDFAGRRKQKDVKGRILVVYSGDWTLAALAFGPKGTSCAPGTASADAFLASFQLREPAREPYTATLSGGASLALPAGSFRIGAERPTRPGAISSSVYYLPGRATYLLVEEVPLAQADCLRNWDTPGALKPDLAAQKDVKFLEPVRLGALQGWYLEGMIASPTGPPRRAAGALVCGKVRALQLFVGGKGDVDAAQRALAQTLAQSVRLAD